MNNLTGLSYHRLIVPFGKVSNMQEFQCDVFEQPEFLPEDKLQQYQAIVFQRNIDETGKSLQVINKLRKLGLKIIFDIDDFWHLAPTHHLYNVYKTNNLPKQTEEILRNVDLVTTTTEHLANIIKQFNKNVEVIPNCLNLDEPQWQSNKMYSETIRFGYIAGVYHISDMKILERPIEKALFGIDNCSFTLGGYTENAHYKYYEQVLSCNNKAKERYRRVNALPVEKYGFAYNHTDVSLIPLDITNFSVCKSEIKLLEAAAHGNAAIVSNTKPYNIFPKTSAVFLGNYDSNGWYKAIKKLTEDKAYREDKASELGLYVKLNYDLNKWTRTRKEILQSVLA